MKRGIIVSLSIFLSIVVIVSFFEIRIINKNKVTNHVKAKASPKVSSITNTRTSGTTSQRPDGVPHGFVYFDTSLKRPIYWNGKGWVTNSTIDMKDFGAKGDGKADDTATIQKALDMARDFGNVKLYFPAGTYNTTALRLYKNTTIDLHSKAIIKRIGSGYKVFINGQLGNSNYAKGYSGEGNIHFTGGTIDLNSLKAPVPFDNNISAFDLAHAENITFKNLTVINGQNGHYFQVSSCENVVFDGCWFGDVRYTDFTTKNFELIQIEEATELSFPTFGSYDGTISKNITIQNCHFENVVRAIGTHSYVKGPDGITPIRYCENIKVIHNVFINSISQFARFEGYKNVIFENNTLKNSGEEPIYFYQSKDYIVKNNKIIRTVKK